MAAAKEAASKGPVRYTSPYDFMLSPSNGMTAIGPPWSEITAYDLNTGEIKWRVPHGGVTAPPELGIKADSGSHMPRGGPLVTAGGLVFVATASDRTVRAYDRDSGKVVWTKDLPTGSEGVPATYEVGGRQFIVFPVAAGAGLFPARFGGPAPAARGGGWSAAAGGGPEAQAGGRGRGGRAGGRLRRRARTSPTRCRGNRDAECTDVISIADSLGRAIVQPRRDAVVLGTGVIASSAARNQIAPGDWPNLNRDLAATRFSPLTQINTSNVGSLKQAWTYRLGGGATSVPLVVGGVMYASSGPQVVALDADTGKEIWSYTVPAAPAATPPPVSDAQASAPRRHLPVWLRRQVVVAVAVHLSPARRSAASGTGPVTERLARARDVHERNASVCGRCRNWEACRRIRHRRHRQHRRSVQRHPHAVSQRRDHRRQRQRGAAGAGWKSARLRCEDRQEAVGVPDRSQAWREIQRHLGRRLEGTLGHQHVGRSRRPSMWSAGSCICRLPDRPPTTTAAIDLAETTTRTRSSPSMRRPGNISGTSRRSITTSGTRTCRRRAASSTSCRTAGECRRSRTSGRRAICSCSIA